ncbi:MAG: histidine kinase [Porticoccaceae bacterium]|nr:histidine kinase [Porticoccaceae bacterium]
MLELKSRFNGSVMTYIVTSIIAIVGLSILTMLSSYWVTEQADKDALAINVSGALRVQTYELGYMAATGNSAQLQTAIDRFAKGLEQPLFQTLQKDSQLQPAYQGIKDQWQILRQVLTSKTWSEAQLSELLATQVSLTNHFVSLVQKSAEAKIRLLRSIQLAALLATLVFAVFIIQLLKMRVQQPLAQLTYAAHRIGKGDFTQRLDIPGDDELALMAATLNHTCDAIASMYGQLENRVKEQTLELKRNNDALAFLFRTARMMLEHPENPVDYQLILDELAAIIDIRDIELCLMTPAGDKPYAQVQPEKDEQPLCGRNDCGNCHCDNVFVKLSDPQSVRFPLIHAGEYYGVLVIRNFLLEHSWQFQLVQSVADQVSLSLGLKERHNQDRRLALMQERTVIARELHDSLAQALSYLKIQVTRLDKAQLKQSYELQKPIIDELRMGLDSAYRQLRELLTTFRLKMTGEGLYAALSQTVDQFTEQSALDFHLNFAAHQVPFSPMEEIHLLQIAREACQNAVHHSKGKNVWVNLSGSDDNVVTLTVADDGVGVEPGIEKINHYGMAIMQERARHLHGELRVAPRQEAGTLVSLKFSPGSVLATGT